MITDMATDIAKLLYEKELAARSFELGWQCSDAQIGRLYFHLSRPSRNADILNRLFAGAAERIDAEYGIDYSWLQAYQLASDLPVTAFLDIDSTDQEAQKIDHVLDILAAKLGPEKIRRAVHHPVWQISDSTTYRPLADTRQTASWPVAAPGSLTPPRPIRLFDPAEPAYVTALLPDNPPALLRWRHKSWKIIKATGPERIGPRWWDNSCKSTKTRDYYRIETSTGLRLWIYREGLPERSEPAQWFVHGSFA